MTSCAALFCSVIASLAFAVWFTGWPVHAQAPQGRLVVRLDKQIADPAWLDDSTLLVTIKGLAYRHDIGLVDLKSGEIRQLRPGVCPSPSPNHDMIAWIQGRDSGDASILDLRAGSQRQLTTGVRVTCLSWSPDGRRIAMRISPLEEGHDEIRVISADSGRTEQVIDGGDLKLGRPTWAPDARRLFFPVYRFVWTSLSPPRYSHPVRRIELFDVYERRRSLYLDLGSGDEGVGGLTFRKDGQIMLFNTGAPAQIVAYDGRTATPLTTGRAPAWHQTESKFIFARGYDCAKGEIICAGDDLYVMNY